MGDSKSVKIKLQVEKALAAKNIKEFKKEFNDLLKELGKTDEEIKAFHQLAKDIDAGTASMSDMDGETQDLMRSYQQLDRITRDRNFLGVKSHAAAKTEIDKVKSAYDRLKKTGKLTSTELAQAAVKANAKIKRLEQSTNGWKQSLVDARYELGQMAVAGAGIGYMVKQAIDFESAMADVSKVLSGTDEEIQSLSAQLKGMAENSTLSAVELAKIAEEGAKLGVPIERIGQFTDLAQKMAVAFDLSAEASGQSIAKLTNVLDLSIDQVETLGDSINQLGNNTAATEAQLVDSLVRIGGTSKQFGLAAEEAAALSAALIAMGYPAETASRSINVMLSKLQTANVQSNQFQDGLAGIGVSAEQMAADIQANPQQALNKFLETLRHMDTQARAEAITQMFGQEHQAKIAALVNNLDQYNEALGLSTDKAAAAGAMQAEFEKRMATSEAQLDKLLNTLNNIAINVGTALLPPLNEMVDVLGDGAKAIADFTEANPGIVELGTLLGGIAVSAAGLKTVFLALNLGVLDFGRSGVSALTELGVGLDVAFAKGNRLASMFNTLGAALVGWQIGTYLRDEFEIAEKAGIVLASTVHGGFRSMQGAWEMFVAVFTDDTMSDAADRMVNDLVRIRDGYQELLDEVDQRPEEGAQKMEVLAEATEEAGTAIEKTGGQAAGAAPQLDGLAAAAGGAAEAFKTISAENARAAASYLVGIENATTQAEVNRVLAQAAQELGDNIEVMGVVSEASAKKGLALADSEKKIAAEAEKAADVLRDKALALAKVNESTSENYDAMLRLAGAYRRGEIGLREYYDAQYDLIQKNIELRASQDNVKRSTRETADSMRDLGDAGQQAGDDIVAGMNRAAEAADAAAERVRRSKNNLTQEDVDAGVVYTSGEGTPIPRGIAERQREIAVQYGDEAAQAFMQAVLAAIKSGQTEVEYLMAAGNKAAVESAKSAGKIGNRISGGFGAQSDWQDQQDALREKYGRARTVAPVRHVLEIKTQAGSTEIGVNSEQDVAALIDALERSGLVAT